MCEDIIILQNEGGVNYLIKPANVGSITGKVGVGGEICIGV
jgi:hypothetical protein